MDKGTFLLTLERAAGQPCMQAFRDMSAAAAGNQASAAREAALPAVSFDSIAADVAARTAPAMAAAGSHVSELDAFTSTSLGQLARISPSDVWGFR